MRQAVGSTWILQLVIIFMLIFVAFLALSINYTKAFKTKNELVNMIEEKEGIGSSEDSGALMLINNYLSYNNYNNKGRCEVDEYGVSSLDVPIIDVAEVGEKYYYCVKKISSSTDTLPNRARYQIRIFFNFSLPIIGNIFTFSVEGTTIDINHALLDIE